MIYLKNNNEQQTIFIPRNELQKEAYITSTKTYEDGYREGLEDGKEYQKDQLLNLYVTENGQYEREDGWGTVTVDIPIGECPDCPEGGSCNLGEGDIYLTVNDAGTYELYASDDGYDGWSKFYVTLENGGAIKIHKASDLIDFFNNGGQIDFGAYCYVGGKITEIEEINVEFGNATYVLDNGFKIYRGKWMDDNPFGEDQIKVGGYIVVYGIIQDYKGELQLKKHSQVIAYQECEGGEIVSCNLEDKWVTPSMGDRDDNGLIVVEESEGFDGLSRVVIDPTTIYNEGVTAGKAEGGDLNIGAVTTFLGVGDHNGWVRSASQFGLDGITEITIDGRDYQEWTKGRTLLEAYNTTDEIHIMENGEYRPVMGYDGFAIRGYNVAWITDVIPTIDTDVEIWVKPYDGATNVWPGFIGSQVSDDDNTTFQIRKTDGSNTFSFRFGEQTFDYEFEYERWYRLRMNRRGVWVNGEQVCGWDVRAFEENPNPLMINGIYNLGFESENYRMNYAAYGYIYFHNSDSLLVPNRNGSFIGNKNRITQRQRTSDATLSGERNYYPNGYTKVTVDVQNGGGNCDDAYNSGYNQGYNDGQANCGGGSANLINPIIFSESEGNAINAESVEIPTFVYEGNQHYNVWALNMAEYEEFKIQLRFQPNNGGNEEPVNIFGCEDTDWDNTTFGARIYMGTIFFRMSGQDVEYPYTENAWYDVEMGYNSSKRWFIVNGETLLETDHAWFTKPSQTFMIGAINSGGNAFRPFYGKIAAAYVETNGSQVWLLPKEEGQMDVYWNDKSSPWVSISGENNARFEKEFISGDGMKSITWLGKRISCPSVQDEALLYDTIAFSYTVDGWRNHNLIRENMTNDCGDQPLDCLLLRNRYGECTVMTTLDVCSGSVRLEYGWNGGSIIYSLKSNTITKFSNSSINSYHLKSIDTGFAQLEENAIMNCNNLTDIKVTILNNDLSYQFATNCFNGLPTEGTITIKKNGSVVTLTDDEITTFFRAIVGEGWTITIK